MKVAHLILAHKNPEQLSRLIKALDHPGFDFYIHVDKKYDEAPFRTLLAQKNVFFVNKRTKIYWGDWGTIQATLNGFEAILDKNYSHINVISGQDFPIKPSNYIYNYFVQNKSTEFITCDFIEGEWSDVASRISDYHLINWRMPGKHRLEKVLTKILPKRKFPLNYEIVGRANWFSLTNEAVKYALKFLQENPKIIKYFRYCWGADEFIFSTILYNSSFKKNIKNNLVYVDWNKEHVGHPKILQTIDFDKLLNSDKLFARKFDINFDAAIFKKIEEKITLDQAKPGVYKS
ncbi:MAG: beta-1,6-N-acetylglucosaminyltransferase [Bacteroidota bacterium]|nr:beta-1,6-N-acetylglucosaminyltransferase [Bacteroidota bacterium]